MSNATPEFPPAPTAVALLCLLHDGDDRCGCLRFALQEALIGARDGLCEVDEWVGSILADCLAKHPAGERARGLGFIAPEVSD